MCRRILGSGFAVSGWTSGASGPPASRGGRQWQAVRPLQTPGNVSQTPASWTMHLETVPGSRGPPRCRRHLSGPCSLAAAGRHQGVSRAAGCRNDDAVVSLEALSSNRPLPRLIGFRVAAGTPLSRLSRLVPWCRSTYRTTLGLFTEVRHELLHRRAGGSRGSPLSHRSPPVLGTRLAVGRAQVPGCDHPCCHCMRQVYPAHRPFGLVALHRFRAPGLGRLFTGSGHPGWGLIPGRVEVEVTLLPTGPLRAVVARRRRPAFGHR